MRRITDLTRWLIALTFVFSLVTPLTAYQARADFAPAEEGAEQADDAPPTGTLQLWLSAGDTQSLLGGACFDVVDASGEVHSVCDYDFDGVLLVSDLPAGFVSARQTTPANLTHAAEAYGETEIVAGELVELRLTNDPYPTVPAEPEATGNEAPTTESEPAEDVDPAAESTNDSTTDPETSTEPEPETAAQTSESTDLAPEQEIDAPEPAAESAAGLEAAVFTLADEQPEWFGEITVTLTCPTFANGTYVGASITFGITVQNTGTLPLSNVEVYSNEGEFDSPFPTTLDPGESQTRTLFGTINIFDAELGFIEADAVASAAPVEGPDGEEWFPVDFLVISCDYNPVPRLSVAKSCPDGLAEKRVGDPIIYEIIVTNTGDLPLPNVEIYDDRDGSFTGVVPAELEPNGSFVVHFESTILPSDAVNGHVNNTFLAASMIFGRHVAASVVAECAYAPLGQVAIFKQCPAVPSGIRVGQIVAYPVRIENTGDVPLQSISVIDTRTGSFNNPFPATLLPGEFATRLFLSPITASDAATESLDNGATVSALAGSAAVEDVATVECFFEPTAEISISKECPEIPDDFEFPLSVAFPVTITNTGDVPLDRIVVDEDEEGAFDGAFPDTLAPGESATVNFITVLQSNQAEGFDNSVWVEAQIAGEDEEFEQGIYDSAYVECQVFDFQPDLSITKTCLTDLTGAQVGDPVEFAVTIAANGEVNYADVLVVEYRDGEFNEDFPSTLSGEDGPVTRIFTTYINSGDGYLEPGVVNWVDVYANIAGGQGGGEGHDVWAEASAICPYTQTSAIEIAKQCPDLEGVQIGAIVDFPITITNTGGTILFDISLFEDRNGSFNSEPIYALSPFSPPVAIEFSSEITATDIARGSVDNTITVTTAEGAFDTATVSCALTHASDITIEKSCPYAPYGVRVGAPIVFTVMITNNGDITLTDVAVTETRAGAFNLAFPTSLAPGQSVTRFFTSEITFADAAGYSIDNEARVTANAGQVVVSDTEELSCDFYPLAAIAGFVEQCPSAVGPRVGDEVTFVFTISNLGDVPLYNVELDDSEDGTFTGEIPNPLPPGESFTINYTRTITEYDALFGDLYNFINIYSMAPNEDTVSWYISEACAYEPFVEITITKSCPTNLVGAVIGTSVAFVVRVENTGDLTLTNIVVTDHGAGSFVEEFPDAEEFTLEPGDWEERTFVRTITEFDAEFGQVNNRVSVSAETPRYPSEVPPPVFTASDEFIAICAYELYEAIEITKQCPSSIPDGARIDTAVIFSITIRNLGDHPLTDIVVSDARNGFFSAAWPSSLGVGESATRSFTTLINEDDTEGFAIVNVASVQASGLTKSFDESATAECAFTPHADLELTITCPSANDLDGRRVGQPVMWGISVRNTGDVTLRVDDVAVEREGSLDEPFGDIPPGDVAVRYFTGPILLSDAETSSVNFIIAIDTEYGSIESPLTLQGIGSAACDYTPTSGISVVKQCPSAQSLNGARIGDPVSYQITITNTGDLWLDNLDWIDSRSGSFDPPIPAPSAQLAAGAIFTTTFTSIISAQDALNGHVNNTITVNAYVLGSSDDQIGDQYAINCSLTPTTGIEIAVTCPTIPAGLRVGQSISVPVTIRNIGDLPAAGITVETTRPGTFVPPLPVEPLAVGATYTGVFITEVTYTDADVGSIDALFNLYSTSANAHSDTLSCGFSPVSIIEVVKSCTEIPVGHGVGDTVTYTITISNPGDTFHTGIVVTDSRDGTLTGSISFLEPTADPVTLTFTTAITEADVAAGAVSNTVTVTTASETGTDSDTAECLLSPGTVEITKTGDGEPLADACFELTGAVDYEPACTDETGFVRFSDVEIGSYTLSETSTPDGFVPMTPRSVTVGHDELVALDIDNALAPVTITVFNLDCAEDPGAVSGDALAADPGFNPDGCVRGAGVSFTLSDDDGGEVSLAAFSLAAANSFNNPYVTGVNGSFSEQVEVGSTILITQDVTTVTPGYLPNENPITLADIQGGEIAVFVNLPQDGALKLRKLVCKVEKASPVKFELLAGGFGDIGAHCWRGGKVAFTISGGNLTAPLAVATNREGFLSIGLTAGTYTLTEVGTKASTTFTVTANATTRIEVTNYKVKPEKPEDPKKPDEVKELPDTGAGSLGIAGGNDWLLGLLSFGIAGFALAGLLVSRARLSPITRRSVGRR